MGKQALGTLDTKWGGWDHMSQHMKLAPLYIEHFPRYMWIQLRQGIKEHDINVGEPDKCIMSIYTYYKFTFIIDTCWRDGLGMYNKQTWSCTNYFYFLLEMDALKISGMLRHRDFQWSWMVNFHLLPVQQKYIGISPPAGDCAYVTPTVQKVIERGVWNYVKT